MVIFSVVGSIRLVSSICATAEAPVDSKCGSSDLVRVSSDSGSWRLTLVQLQRDLMYIMFSLHILSPYTYTHMYVYVYMFIK